MKHQLWMNDKLDEQTNYPSRSEYANQSSFPIFYWYWVSAAFTVVVLFV